MTRGAKISAEMRKARKMIEASHGDASAQSVAEACGLTTGAITRSKWYRDYMAPFQADRDSAMERARKMVVEEGKTAYAAAKLTGLSQSTICRAAWYRSHVDGGKTC